MNARSTSLAAALSLALAAGGAFAAPPLDVQRAMGGQPADPLDHGELTYVPTGTVITAVDYSEPGAPLVAGDSGARPAPGTIVSLARRGGFLYAAYNGFQYEDRGVAVYSIADPGAPTLVSTTNDYSDAEIRTVGAVAVVGDQLYLFDRDAGIFRADLAADPDTLSFVPALSVVRPYDNAFVQGDRIYTSGRTFLFGTAYDVFDVSDPTAPAHLGGSTVDGFGNFRMKFDAPYAFGFGYGLHIHDIATPDMPTEIGTYDDFVTTYYTGVTVGDHVYGLGDGGVHVIDVSDPTMPTPLAPLDVDGLGTDAATAGDGHVTFVTRTDRIVRLDAATPASPAFDSEVLIRGSAAPYDIAFGNGHAFVLSNASGFVVSDAQTLAPQVRFEADLDRSLQARAFEQMALEGDLAYLASWGSGLVIADVSDPLAPVQVGHWFAEFASTVDVAGDIAFVGFTTNGGQVVSVDVSDPSAPIPLDVVAMNKTMRVQALGDLVFAADQPQNGLAGGGLRIIDASNPESMSEVALYDQDCGFASNLELSADGTRMLLACFDRVQVLDMSTPTAPVRLGEYLLDEPYGLAWSGNRAWVGHVGGIDEIDLSDVAAPTLVKRTSTATTPRTLRLSPDGRLFAVTDLGGVYQLGVEPEIFADGFEAPAD